MTRVAALAVTLLLATPAAWAAEVPRGSVVRFRGDTIVWRSVEARQEGRAVGRANPFLALGYVACSVTAGTSAVVVDTGGVFSNLVTIVVTSSEESGCRGVVEDHELQVQRK